jgi:hypothetical protein
MDERFVVAQEISLPCITVAVTTALSYTNLLGGIAFLRGASRGNANSEPANSVYV